MVSISCPSIIYLLYFFLIIKDITKYRVRIVIKVKIIIAWSWKNRICSIAGEILSWKDKAIHVGITYRLRVTVWLKVCSLTGVALSHSIELFLLFVEIDLREVDKASQIIHIKKITDTKEIRDPKDETIFHEIKASG